MEEALVDLLLADAGVAAAAGNRVWWNRAPQGRVETPYVVLRRISGQRDYHMAAPSGLVESRVQFDSYGKDYAAAKTTARAVQAVVSGYRGTAGGTVFQGIFIDTERDLPDAETPGAVDRLHAVSFDATIWHD